MVMDRMSLEGMLHCHAAIRQLNEAQTNMDLKYTHTLNQCYCKDVRCGR